jgi:hypothetical protein
MLPWYRLFADCVAIVHAGYLAFVVVGLALVIIGIVKGWGWVRNFWFRAAHLIAISLVCIESFLGIACPLTVLEDRLRVVGGVTGYSGDFVGYWIDRLIFYDFTPWVFMAAYAVCGLMVAALFIIAPPHRPRRLGANGITHKRSTTVGS